MIKGTPQFAPWTEDEDPDPPTYWTDEDYEEMRRRIRRHFSGDDIMIDANRHAERIDRIARETAAAHGVDFQITMAPESIFLDGKEDYVRGVVIHEIGHVKFEMVRDAITDEQTAAHDVPGTPTPLVDRFRKTAEQIDELRKGGGITAYSKQFWEDEGDDDRDLVLALHETIAEMMRVKDKTGIVKGTPAWTAYYHDIMSTWDELNRKRTKASDMIERVIIDNKPAIAAYIDGDWEPCEREDATLIKVLFDDSMQPVFLNSRTMAKDALRPWDELKHSRGQPENAGQFGPGGGGSSASKSKSAPREFAAAVLARAARRPTGEAKPDIQPDPSKAKIVAPAEAKGSGRSSSVSGSSSLPSTTSIEKKSVPETAQTEQTATKSLSSGVSHNYGLVEGDAEKYAAYKVEWAQINDKLLDHVDDAAGHEAQALSHQLEALSHKIQGLRADPGTHEGIGLPGGPRDVVVVGAGPGGLAAGINGAAEGLDTLLIEANVVAGGQAKYSSRIENFPGWPIGVTGERLTRTMFTQAERLGATTKLGTRVTSMDYDEATGLKHLTLSNGDKVVSRTVILAGGVEFRKMKFEGAEGPGVHSGDPKPMMAEGKGGTVLIVGGANSAAQAALGCAKVAKHVYIMSRSPVTDAMSAYQVDAVRNHPKITVIEGDSILRLTRDKDNKPQTVETSKGQKIDVNVIGGFIGSVPKTEWLHEDIKRDEAGKVHAEKDFKTDIPGVFAAGDMRVGAIGRVGVAVGEGQFALREAHVYLKSLKPKKEKKERKKDSISDADKKKSDDPPIAELFKLDRESPWFAQSIEPNPPPEEEEVDEK